MGRAGPQARSKLEERMGADGTNAGRRAMRYYPDCYTDVAPSGTRRSYALVRIGSGGANSAYSAEPIRVQVKGGSGR